MGQLIGRKFVSLFFETKKLILMFIKNVNEHLNDLKQNVAIHLCPCN